MAKSENPIDVYRKQQRKKEVKKNKTARIKARDDKVAATRSIEDVKAEISLLERKRDRNDEKAGLDAIETKKLERLQKELRIVSAESAKRRALAEQAQIERDRELLAAQKTVAGVQKLNESKYSLVERFASVYYDEKMNPFGAPAPGQPKLYFADAGGKTTTMDSRRAVVPEKLRSKFDLERGVKDEKSRSQDEKSRAVVARKRLWDDPGDIVDNQHQMATMHPSLVDAAAPQHVHPPPPSCPPSLPYLPPQMVSNIYQPPPLPPPPPQMLPPPPPPMQPPPPPPILPPPPPLPPLPPPPPPPPPLQKEKIQPPPLPAPSKAVLRAAKRSSGNRNAMADIWASQEEMEYEQTVGGKSSMAMEGTADQQPQQPYLPRWKRNKTNPVKSKDCPADVNDPCCPNADGYGEYRNREQIERQSKEVAELQKQQHEHAAKYVTTAMSTLQHKSHSLPPSLPPPLPTYNVQQPIWYYRDNTSGAIQGPFSGDQMMGWRAFFPLFTPVRFGNEFDGTFVPLSEIDFMNPPITPVPPPPPASEEEIAAVADQPIYDSNDDDGHRQYRLKSKPEESQPSMLPEFFETEVAESQPEVEMCVPPPSDDEDDFTSDVDDRDNNTNGDCIDPEVDLCIPPPSDDEADDEDDDHDKDDDNEIEMCVPPSIDEYEGDHSEIPYPAVEQYPFPIDEELPYPVDVEYPIDDETYGYPGTGGVFSPGEMSAVAPYPFAGDVVFGVTEESDGRTEDHGVMPPVEVKKKEYTGDKEVVGFVPSHLQVKRKITKSKKSATPTPKTKPTQGYSVAEDYNKFMEEISELT